MIDRSRIKFRPWGYGEQMTRYRASKRKLEISTESRALTYLDDLRVL